MCPSPGHILSQSDWPELARDNVETNPITIKSETSSQGTEQFRVPFTFLLSAWAPCPLKSLALSACVSPWTIHFQVLDKAPLRALEGGPPSCNRAAQRTFRRKWLELNGDRDSSDEGAGSL